jgi:hypothetical protein
VSTNLRCSLRNNGKVYDRHLDGPGTIRNIIASSCYEISDKVGKMRGTVNKAAWENREWTECIVGMLIGGSGRSERDIANCI